MLNQIHIDRRVFYGFMIIMTVMNAFVFFIPWKEMLAGKSDLPHFYASAQMVREGQASRIYDFEAENRFVARVSDVTRPPNIHLPYEILIFLPFTYLQFSTAHILWSLLSVGMLVGVALLMRGLRAGGAGFWLTLLTILAFFPVWYCLLQGQDSILLMFLFALSFWFWRRGQGDLAGFVMALGLFRPQLVLPLVLVAFLGGKFKFVRGFIPGAVLVGMLSVWVVGLQGIADYVRTLIAQGTQGSANILLEKWHLQPGLMPTLRGLLWIGLPSWVPGNVRNLLFISGTFGGLLWAGKRMRSAGDEGTFDLAFAIAVAVSTLLSFHSFLHDFSLMILALLIGGDAVASSVRASEKDAYLIVTLGFLFFLTPLYLVVALLTPRVGIFAVPTVVLLWLMGRWESDHWSVSVHDQNMIPCETTLGTERI